MPANPPRRGRPPKDPDARKAVLNSRIDPRLRRRLEAAATRHFAGFLIAAHEEALRLGLDAIEARED